jgi:hypothetical protein
MGESLGSGSEQNQVKRPPPSGGQVDGQAD